MLFENIVSTEQKLHDTLNFRLEEGALVRGNKVNTMVADALLPYNDFVIKKKHPVHYISANVIDIQF